MPSAKRTPAPGSTPESKSTGVAAAGATGEMTPRQRWLALLNRQTPDRVPTDYWSTPEFHQRLKKDLGCADDEAPWTRLHIDGLKTIGPKALRRHHPNDPKADVWGVRFRNIDYGTGSYSEAEYH